MSAAPNEPLCVSCTASNTCSTSPGCHGTMLVQAVSLVQIRRGQGALVKGRCAFDEGRLSGNCAFLMALVGVRAALSLAHSPTFLGVACCTSQSHFGIQRSWSSCMPQER